MKAKSKTSRSSPPVRGARAPGVAPARKPVAVASAALVPATPVVSAVSDQDDRSDSFFNSDLHSVVELSPDPIAIIDPVSMRFLYVNEISCRAANLTREQYLRLTVMDMTGISCSDLERNYAEAIKKSGEHIEHQFSVTYNDGRRYYVDGHTRALRQGDRWVIVTVSRDITERRLAEKANARRSRLRAMLSGANEAMLRSKSPTELYQHMCDAAVRDGQFTVAAVFAGEPEAGVLMASVVSGACQDELRAMRVPLDADAGESADLVVTAYRTAKHGFANNISGNGDSSRWSEFAQRSRVKAAVALPLIRNNNVLGVLLLASGDRLAFDDEAVAMLLGMTENIPLALENFERDAERMRTEEELLRFRAVMDASPDLVFFVDPQAMRFLYVNDTGGRMSGYSAEEYKTMNPAQIANMESAELKRVYDEVIAMGGGGITREIMYRAKDGLPGWFETHRRAVRMGEKWIIVNISREISSRKLAEKSAVWLSRMYATLGATNEAIMHAKSSQDLYQRVCEAAVNGGKFLAAAVLLPELGSTRMTISAVVGTGAEQLSDAHVSIDASLPEGNGLVGAAFRTRKPSVSNDLQKDERMRPWHEHAVQVGVKAGAAVPLVHGGRTVGVLLFHSDEKRAFNDEVVKLLERMAENIAFALDNFAREAERKRSEERIKYLATHDALTGLPNRTMFNQLLSVAIESARRNQRQLAVFFIDLDRFKIINDTISHEAGDKLLQELATRFKHTLRNSDVVARFGGDEFVVLVPELSGEHQAEIVAHKILSATIKPMMLMGQEMRVTASIGISLYPADAGDEESLIKNADLAMYLAKEEGKNNFQFYSQDIKSRSLERLALERNLRTALEREEFSLHYQAKLDLKTGAINGVEALLRWQNPLLGNVSPAQFIPIAEETGLIVPIGKWVLRTACKQNVAWTRQGFPPLGMAVNLSARQFGDPNLLNDIAEAIADSGMAPELLELELTEGMVMQNIERAAKTLAAIKHRGARIAIDDFGTGYSSLAQIKRFPIDTLKIDRSFIREIPQDEEDKAITEAIIAMGKTLGLTVVAEGVETKEQAEFLRQHGCDEMQGYYFSKPIPPDRFEQLLGAHLHAAHTPARPVAAGTAVPASPRDFADSKTHS